MSDKERELPDDYPIYDGYLYVVDGVPTNAMPAGTVGDAKRRNGFKSVKSCDVEARDLWHLVIE